MTKIFLLFAFILATSCFGGGIDKRGSVKSFQNGVITTEGGYFFVGMLATDWIAKPTKHRIAMFSHQNRAASISVNSFCKDSLDDAPLNILANQLFYGMTRQKKIVKKNVTIDDRQALRDARKGISDGAPLALDVVVLKMNGCLFDFSLVASPKVYPQVVKDFEAFYSGFRYKVGP